MRIFRGPRSTDNWTETDSKPLREWAKDWWPSKKLRFDGTIDKSGQRHTDLGIQIDSDEILALHEGLIRYQKNRIKELEKRSQELSDTVELLEEALRKIHHLALFQRHSAPNDEELINAVREIADHFRWSHTRSKPVKLSWVKWKDI